MDRTESNYIKVLEQRLEAAEASVVNLQKFIAKLCENEYIEQQARRILMHQSIDYEIDLGEMMYRCPEHIDKLQFVEQTDRKLEFWDKEGYEIHEWENKYDKENNYEY